MKWLRTAGMILAGILVAVGFAILGRPARLAKAAEQRTEQLLADGSERALNKAVKESAKADKLKADAFDSAKAGQAAIDRIGANNEDMASILADWNTDRVQ